ncbi:MAG TPA: polysaccharide deacetylase family protein [Bauldia sp.]|nr:polysaccharide deacetylase family protein [Bauldia sp.]
MDSMQAGVTGKPDLHHPPTSGRAYRDSNPRIPFRMSSHRPPLAAPNGKPLIVHVIVNVEYWPFERPTPRTIVVPPHGASHVPDVPNFSWAEYGNRCGVPRLLRVLGDRKVPASLSINASAIEVYPSLADECRAAGWEFVGHGVEQRSLSAEPDERAMISRALEQLEQFCGRRPRGWMSPGWSETFDTPDYLRAAGIEYIFEWAIDDLPNWMWTKHGPLIAMPYGLDLNDSVVVAIEKHSTTEFRLRVEETVKTFIREIDETGQPRVLTLPLHPHLMAVPHRINGLIDIIEGLQQLPQAIFMTGSEIAEWFVREVPAPELSALQPR